MVSFSERGEGKKSVRRHDAEGGAGRVGVIGGGDEAKGKASVQRMYMTARFGPLWAGGGFEHA